MHRTNAITKLQIRSVGASIGILRFISSGVQLVNAIHDLPNKKGEYHSRPNRNLVTAATSKTSPLIGKCCMQSLLQLRSLAAHYSQTQQNDCHRHVKCFETAECGRRNVSRSAGCVRVLSIGHGRRLALRFALH
jgi:hypothetical protein